MSVRDEFSATTLECFDKLKARCNEYDVVAGIMDFVSEDEDRKKIIEYLDSHPDADKWDIQDWVLSELVSDDDDDDGEYPLG